MVVSRGGPENLNLKQIGGPDRVPIISNWERPNQPFGGGGRHLGVDDPGRMLHGFRTPSATSLEAGVGLWNTVQASLLASLAERRRAVAMITVPQGQNYEGITGYWTGTGFLVAPDVLLTNHHVINSVAVAEAAQIEFGFERPPYRLGSGPAASGALDQPPSMTFRLNPKRLFVTSPAEGGLDYAFIGIDMDGIDRFGFIQMERGSFTSSLKAPVFVIHHPQGRPKEASIDDTETLGINEDCLLYAADTDYGSSGSCVLNDEGRLIALHHARRTSAEMKRLYPGALTTLLDGHHVSIANEGIKIAAIAVDLEARLSRGGKDAASAARILQAFDGSDTLTGVFGAMGREAQADGDHMRSIELYRARNQDVDIGFWSLDWLEEGVEQKIVDEVATAMVDVNPNLWCLSGASIDRVRQIAAALTDRFGENVETLMLSSVATQSNRMAAIYRPAAIKVTRTGWPGDLNEVFTRPVSALGRPIFDASPARLRIAAVLGDRPLLDVVCIDFARFGDDEPRRRLASKFLVRAIDRAIAEDGTSGDWIIGGDYRPPLAREDSAALTLQGYDVVAVRDRPHGGAISYLRSPNSETRHVYVTADLDPVDQGKHFLTRLTDRVVERHFAEISQTHPSLIRISLKHRSDERSDDALSRMADRAFARARGATEKTEAAPLQYEGLSKPKFLHQNRKALTTMITAAMGAHDGTVQTELTLQDVWVIVYSEAGLRNGFINPDARHSLGERGLLPLPSNIRDWIGPDAPRWDKPMSLATNFSAYLRYLVALKNRTVRMIGPRGLYSDLFRELGILENAERQARLLAGIVHGYFVSANYDSSGVPVERILQGYAEDQPITQILNNTGYVHDKTNILKFRQKNIDAAMEAFDTHI